MNVNSDTHSGPSERDDDNRPEVVARLFHEHNRALLNFLSLRLRSMDEAREVAQEAYARLLQLHRQGTPGFLRFYLFRVATNLVVDRLRQRKRRSKWLVEPAFEPEFNVNRPEADALVQQELQRLSMYLDELPEKCRQAMVMFRLEDLGQDEIALRLDITPRMVRRYISYGLAYCRMRIDGLGSAEVKEQLKI